MLIRLFTTAALAVVLAGPTFAQTSGGSSDTQGQGTQAETAAGSEQSQQGGATTGQTGGAATTTGGMQKPAQGEAATAEGEQPAEGEAATAGAMQTEGQGETIIAEQGQSEMLAENLIGLSLTNQQKEEIGQVNDLILDENGKLSGVVVGVGGFLGVGEKNVGVAWDRISFSPEQDIATVELSRQQLEQAPEFKSLEDTQGAQQTQ